MLPQDLVRDLERDQGLKTFSKAWAFVLEQCPLRKEWASNSNSKKGQPTPMDLDVMEKACDSGTSSTVTDEAEQCQNCNEDELDILKGAGNCCFSGYCNYCGRWGHRKSECRTLTAALGKGKGKVEAKGDNKGKGDWHIKGGGKSKGKGDWNQKGKGKGKGTFYNIDEEWATQWNTTGRLFLLENFEE